MCGQVFDFALTLETIALKLKNPNEHLSNAKSDHRGEDSDPFAGRYEIREQTFRVIHEKKIRFIPRLILHTWSLPMDRESRTVPS